MNKSLNAAKNLFISADYTGALNIYHQLASEIGHKFFYANIIICLDKLMSSRVNVRSACKNLISKEKFDILNELYSKDIVVSLTSYPARINAVPATLKSILTQSITPGKLLLWLARDQFPGMERDLPIELIQLKEKGLTIEWCEEIRSYKKLIPALRAYSNSIIVTADDDIIYRKNWLAQLLIEHLREPDVIVCHRAHHVLLNEDGGFSSYKLWPKEIKWANSSLRNLFTGCGGVLYPPDSLHKFVHDQNTYLSTCPKGDDLWFWAMAVLAGSKIKPVNYSSFELDFVAGTQDTALWIDNCQQGGNDSMLRALNIRFPEIIHRIKESEKLQTSIQPKVSIIIPVFNSGRYLAECLDSIIFQKFQDFEILCIDDGSTDCITADILTEYSRKDSRIRIIRQQNSGPATARNNGLKNSNGAYIAFIDSDDYISANYIGNLYECAQLNGSDISVADKIICVDGSNSHKFKESGFEQFWKVNSKKICARAIVKTGVVWNKLYKKHFLLNNNIEFLDGMRCQSEDNYFSIVAIVLGHKSISVAENATYFYRQHAGGITKNITIESFDQSVVLYEQLKRKLGLLEILDKQYWLNVASERSFRDLNHLAFGLLDRTRYEIMISKKFKSSIDICCITDTKYVIPTQVLIQSVKNSKLDSSSLTINILVPKSEQKSLEMLQEMSSLDFLINIIGVDTDKFEGLHKYKLNDNYCMASTSALFKFVIPNIFVNLDRIIYIDTDLIVRKDLLNLFMTNIDDEYMCAVPDLWNSVTDRDDIQKFESYFNSGVLLMNLAKMRDENISEKLIEAKLKSTNFNLMDQDVFNQVCNQRIKKLDIKYNFLPVCYKRHKHRFNIADINKIYSTKYKKVEDIALDPFIAHWAGSDKPWVTSSTLYADEWMNIYADLKNKGIITDRFGFEVNIK